ncbi:hypothetical protein J2I47_16715 [Fibrella sp. HMF5335]|uniref:Uncharacterized protein n=1 Tax=Fibrella rubiginis TaxID=2817060 RepID=A0A939K2G7_9BACT|nr:hypothetical protein [Fibrella rubiginis]MBO0938197.1 hypothetical protein [Fibrella rubiginis]
MSRKKAVSFIGFLVCVVTSLVETSLCNAQATADTTRLSLSFSAIHPRANVPEPFTAFIQRGVLNACREAGQQIPNCFYGIDWIHFRITPSNKIDSIRITGDYLPEWLTEFYESKILTSQPFWQYVDKSHIGPILVAIPIDFAFESGCEPKPSTIPTKYQAELATVDSLFTKPKPFLPKLQAVQQSPNRILLGPLIIHSMK